jgi:glycosyltransferase involved in cell wall biosynthesis
MTGIGRYAHALLDHLPALVPHAEWLLLATPRNAAYLERSFRHPRLVGGEDLKLCFPARQEALGRLMRRSAADLYFGTMYDAPDGAGLRSVTTIYDLGFVRFPDMLPPSLTEYTTRAAEHAARRSGAVITVSMAVRDELAAHYGLPAERIVVAPPGVDDCLDARPDDRAMEEVLSRYSIDSPYILSVNLTNSRKNAPRLFGAFRALRQQRSTPLALVVAGGWNLRDANLWRQAYDAGVHTRTVVTGFVPRPALRSLYMGAAVVCVPSLYEGFGMPIAEAMACGTPVVVADRGAMREAANGAGVLVDPESEDSIANGLARALDDDGLRAECIRRGKERAARFTWNAAARAVAGALCTLVGAP